MFESLANSTLYDFKRLMSRFDSKFITKIDLESVKIDSLRGTCTSSALQRLNKVAKIKSHKSFYKLGSSGICLKLKKIYKQDRFNVEFFAMAQYYNLSNAAKKQHKQLLRYLLTKKSFIFTEIDICIDSLKPLELIETSRTKSYKGTQYRDYGDCQMCVYRKDLKPDTHRPKQKGLLRYELTAPLTLRLAKNKRKAKPTKPPAVRKCKTCSSFNINYNKLYKYKLKRKNFKFKNTRDFMRKLDTS